MTLKDIETPQPHFIPGYTGYCPQFIYRVGDTYGQLTHKLIVDPNVVPHTEKLILSNRMTDDYHVKRPILREIDVIRRQYDECQDPVYKYPMIPGYEGFIPKITGKFGQRFSIAATESLLQHQREQLLMQCERRKLKHRGAIQNVNATTVGRSLGERSLTTNDYTLPLNVVRPDRKGVLREVDQNKLAKAPPLPYSRNSPPHFMDNNDPEKYLKLGYSGHKPFTWPRFGYGNKPLTNSALCDFTNNYQHRRSTEWAPITNAGVGSSARPSSTSRTDGGGSGGGGEIYHKNIGLIPNYSGHVPGAMFRFGQTYGNDSRDAKRWLRGDFSS